MPLKLYRRTTGGPYYVRGSVTGNRIHESTGLSNRRQAEAWTIRRETQIIERHALGDAATLTFAEAALEYQLAGGEGRFLAPILDHFGEATRVDDIHNGAVLEAAAALYPNAAPATINRQLIGPVSAVINMAAENGRATPRKFRRLKARGTRTRWLAVDEMERLLEAAGAHLVPILACMIGTGCRASEVLSADVTQWHPTTGELWLPVTKSGHSRMVRMPERARDLILAAGVPDQGRLFRNPRGAGYSLAPRATPIKTAFIRARTEAGLGAEVTPHVLRHTWATWYHSATKDFGGLLDLGGWRSPEMAQRYRKIAPDDLGDQLVAAGWDFTRMGNKIPDPQERRAGLRAI